MIVDYQFLQEIFRAYYIQRWNDRIRPMELIEMDKHALKLVAAYCVAKYEESDGKKIEWNELIKAGIYELFRRIAISDIKSPIYHEIKKNKEVFRRLNKYVFDELKDKLNDKEIREECQEYLFAENLEDKLYYRILEAAHIYASYWEFRIIKQANPSTRQNVRIETELLNKLDRYADLIGVKKLSQNHTIANFIDLIGELRFQYRWAQLPRVPKTSVLGHSLLVAITSYFFARDNKACERRLTNDFFGGLFHDLPEAVTRDILSPVKKSSPQLERLIKDIEAKLMDEEIYPLLEKEWLDEIKYFTQDEFKNKVILDGKISFIDKTETINEKYNKDEFSPYDGEAIKAADNLSAFLEVWNSCRSGIKTEELLKAAIKIKEQDKNKVIGTVSMNEIYKDYTDNL